MVARSLVAIPPKFEKLLAQVRTAQEHDCKLDEIMDNLDIIDALRLNLRHFVLGS
ncbi:MAG: hypothetical protein ACREA4_12510 [Nitrososphaera sp.]